jgi:hypothetical protein
MKKLVVGVFVAGAAVVALSTHFAEASPAGAPNTAVSRQQAIARVLALKKEVVVANRTAAKQLTLAEFEAGIGQNHTSPANFDPLRQVWVVAVGGKVIPQFSHGKAFAYAIYIVDTQTGMITGALAGNAGVWPPNFDSLLDHGTP